MQVEEQLPKDKSWATEMSEMETRYKNMLNTELAGVKASYKNTGAKPKAKPQARGGRDTGSGGAKGGAGGPQNLQQHEQSRLKVTHWIGRRGKQISSKVTYWSGARGKQISSTQFDKP